MYIEKEASQLKEYIIETFQNKKERFKFKYMKIEILFSDICNQYGDNR